MERYVIYLRKSRADIEAESRGEGETLSRHKEALKEFARRHNIVVDDIYMEIVSGETIAARPMMQRLLREVGEGIWTGVLVMEVERLARGDTMDQGLVSQTFKYSGTKIITPLKTYDPANEFDEEYFEFGLFMSRREYVTTNRRLQRGRQASAREGKFVGSIAPFGYRRLKLEKDKGYTLEIVPEQARIVKMIFDLYVNGIKTDGGYKRLGMRGVAHRLNELKIPAVRHGYWQKETIRDIITNPVYSGFIRWGYRKVKKTISPQGKKISRPVSNDGDCIIAKGLHKAIVTEKTFDKAQRLIEKQQNAPVSYQKEIRNPLCGLVICRKCGRKMVLRRGTGQKPDYLKCHSGECDMISAPFHLVEQRILDILEQWLEGYVIEPKPADTDADFGFESRDAAICSLRRELTALENQQTTVYDLLERGMYTDDEFKARISDIKRRIMDICDVLNNLNEEKSDSERRKKTSVKLYSKPESILDVYKALPSAAAKNELLREVLDHVVYDKQKSGSLRGCQADGFILTIFPRLPKS